MVSDIHGKSARQMLQGLVAGDSDIASLADLAKGRLRDKISDLCRALEGRFAAHQRFLLAQQLAHIDALDANIEAVTAEIEQRMQPYSDEIERLETIPGVGPIVAYGIVAELGVDMTKFGTPERCASWTKMAPGMNESAGKRHSGKTGKGNRWIRALLVQAAHSASRSKTYLASQYHRLAGRRGSKKAAVAVGHSILIIAYHILSNPGMTYHDLGETYLDQRRKQRLTQNLVRRLQGLGYYVSIEPAA